MVMMMRKICKAQRTKEINNTHKQGTIHTHKSLTPTRPHPPSVFQGRHS